ncbi:ribonuclease H-like YkuK family protein [Paenibacillus sp. PR3]|uniref:Ribonuclease H-like YkuK family protein n=1 Tax=Paenibacillus terricola TaxID=2763503 RepID=A0ABR8N502_9BACL|nr:ribonuclease H-like YkuK family protein [Paenibacillus terricola]MBD3922621.1 ribonuclease H-like YkuK family protein [Paenibacillus terricola]
MGKKSVPYNDEMLFQNTSESRMTLDDVYARMTRFVSSDVRASYQFVIGTDSQVFGTYTKFITGVIIRRVGKGVWACYRQSIVKRPLLSLKEKLSFETTLSQDTGYLFAGTVLPAIEGLLLPYVYQGAALEAFIDIDAGTEPLRNPTWAYVEEMVNRVKAMGIYTPRTKPDSYGASAYANRFTKRPVRLVM